MVLLARAGRPVRLVFNGGRDLFSTPYPVGVSGDSLYYGSTRQAEYSCDSTMLDGLAAQEVIGLFPEGGLDRHRLDEGHPGIGYLAIKSGAPVIPASIVWEGPHSVTSMVKTLFVPSKATIRYGKPLQFPQESRPSKDSMQSCTKEAMARIEELRKSMLSGVS